MSRRFWVGLSMGGYVAMDIQRLYPETVAGLALCDTMAASDGVGGENRLKMGGRRRTDELGRTGDALRATGRWRFHRQKDS